MCVLKFLVRSRPHKRVMLRSTLACETSIGLPRRTRREKLGQACCLTSSNDKKRTRGPRAIYVPQTSSSKYQRRSVRRNAAVVGGIKCTTPSSDLCFSFKVPARYKSSSEKKYPVKKKTSLMQLTARCRCRTPCPPCAGQQEPGWRPERRGLFVGPSRKLSSPVHAHAQRATYGMVWWTMRG